LFWSQTGESQVFGPEVLKDAEKQVQMVRESLKVAQTRQKSYADKRRRDLLFGIGDFVYLKVSPMRRTRRFKVKGKLVPRYVGPFKIIDRKGEVPSPQAEIAQLAHPARASVASSREIRFPFWFTPSRAGRLFLISLSTGPHLLDVSSPPHRPTPATFFCPLRPPCAARPVTL
jgi:hypothetical protein